MQMILDITRTAIALLFLFYASWSDYKTREVSNKVWALFAPPAFALTFVELVLYGSTQLLLYGICFSITAALGLLLFYSGGFGGADAKALMCLALALPFYPEKLSLPTAVENSPIAQRFFPITVFSNSVLFAAFTAVAILFYNLFWRLRTHQQLFEGDHGKESIGKRILVMITAYKVSTNKLKEKWHIYPMEDIERSGENWKRKLIIVPRDEGRAEIVGRISGAVENGTIPDRVWATPGLPMLIFILAGLITALLFGDIVWTCIRLVLR